MNNNYKPITEDAYEIKVEINGSTDEYAKTFLVIFNNAKAYSNTFYRVTNDYNNGVHVVCKPNSVENVKNWLSKLGEIRWVRKILVVLCPEPEYDLEEYYDVMVIME